MKPFSFKQLSSFMFGLMLFTGTNLHSQTAPSSVGARVPSDQKSKENELEQKLQQLLKVHGLLLNQAIVDAERDASPEAVEKHKKELLDNANQITNVFAFLYSQRISGQFENLFKQHISLSAEYTAAVKEKNQDLANQISNQAFMNGRMLAQFFSELFPSTPLKTWQKVWDDHVSMEAEQTNLYFNKDFGKAQAVRNRSLVQLKQIGNLINSGIQKKQNSSTAYSD